MRLYRVREAKGLAMPTSSAKDMDSISKNRFFKIHPVIMSIRIIITLITFGTAMPDRNVLPYVRVRSKMTSRPKIQP